MEDIAASDQLPHRILAELRKNPERFPVSGKQLAQTLGSTFDEIETAARQLEERHANADYIVIVDHEYESPSGRKTDILVSLHPNA